MGIREHEQVLKVLYKFSQISSSYVSINTSIGPEPFVSKQ